MLLVRHCNPRQQHCTSDYYRCAVWSLIYAVATVRASGAPPIEILSAVVTAKEAELEVLQTLALARRFDALMTNAASAGVGAIHLQPQS